MDVLTKQRTLADCFFYFSIFYYLSIYNIKMNHAVFVSLKLDNGWTDFGNFGFEIFVEFRAELILLGQLVVRYILLFYNAPILFK